MKKTTFNYGLAILYFKRNMEVTTRGIRKLCFGFRRRHNQLTTSFRGNSLLGLGVYIYPQTRSRDNNSRMRPQFVRKWQLAVELVCAIMTFT
jgi:hypothetical protein